MEISHECPIDLLEESKQFNDYDYALLHLMHIPEYKQYYIDAVKSGRVVYLDNSAYEYANGVNGGFDINYYLEIINEVKPTHVIIPDVIANTKETIQNVEDFPYNEVNYNPKYIGVVQGQTIEDLEKCFLYMNNAPKIAVIALVFHSPAYMIDDENGVDYENMMGRFTFFEHIEQSLNKKVHLLGCSLPEEFQLYKNLTQEQQNKIKSIDTANPIQRGILGEEFSYKATSKPKCVLSESVIKGKTKNKPLILNNVKLFRDGLKGLK